MQAYSSHPLHFIISAMLTVIAQAAVQLSTTADIAGHFDELHYFFNHMFRRRNYDLVAKYIASLYATKI